MKNSDIKNLRVYENQRHENYEVDPVSFNEVVEEETLVIGWNVCKTLL